MSEQQLSPKEWLTAVARSLGWDFNVDRAQDRILAENERRKYNTQQLSDRVRAKAAMVRRARRNHETSEWAWRDRPSSENLQAAKDAWAARTEAEAQLLEAVQYDRQLYNSVLKSSV
jgi:hypothetical protein